MSTTMVPAKAQARRDPTVPNTSKERGFSLTQILLACGIFSPLYYLIINIVVPWYYPGYSIASQTVSELSAIGAPTRQLWVQLCLLYSLSVIAFGVGIWKTSNEKQLRFSGAAMILFGMSGFFWPPMHRREVLAITGNSLTDTMHLVFAGGTLVLMLLMMGFGSAALGRKFRLFTIACFLIFLAFGALTGLDGPAISKNAPTPYVGVWERINIGTFNLWTVLFAIQLLKVRRS